MLYENVFGMCLECVPLFNETIHGTVVGLLGDWFLGSCGITK